MALGLSRMLAVEPSEGVRRLFLTMCVTFKARNPVFTAKENCSQAFVKQMGTLLK